LVISKIHLKLKLQKQQKASLKFNTHLLKLPHVSQKFRDTVSQKLSTFYTTNDIGVDNKQIGSVLIQAGGEVLGKRRGKLQPWVGADTMELVTRCGGGGFTESLLRDCGADRGHRQVAPSRRTQGASPHPRDSSKDQEKKQNCQRWIGEDG